MPTCHKTGQSGQPSLYEEALNGDNELKSFLCVRVRRRKEVS